LKLFIVCQDFVKNINPANAAIFGSVSRLRAAGVEINVLRSDNSNINRFELKEKSGQLHG